MAGDSFSSSPMSIDFPPISPLDKDCVISRTLASPHSQPRVLEAHPMSVNFSNGSLISGWLIEPAAGAWPRMAGDEE